MSEQRLCILLVDDSQLQLQLLQELLADDDFDLLTARDGAEGLAVARRQHPDLILMDIEMPVMDGLAAAQELRRDPALATTPIIMVTGRTGAACMERAFVGGCDDFVTKPVHRAELLMKIAALTGRPTAGWR
jgi:two-component system alkaline phosphatase synthesis response regulator PhoP